MSYFNEDLAPIPPQKRTWNAWNYSALWISMSLCIPTYMLASSLIEGGMNWWQAVLTVLLGNTVVIVPMLLNGHAGARYGIPFPVLVRASFGVLGANVPALLRAFVACGWFGIQTWIGGHAIYQMLHVWFPALENLPAVFPAGLELQTGPGICFLLFLALNMFIVGKGIESIRKLLLFKALFLPLAALFLLGWAIYSTDGLTPIFTKPSRFETSSEFWNFFFPSLTAMVGFWATLSLNIPDFTRYATSQRAQILGQAFSLPISMTAFAFIGVVVTSATMVLYGTAVWDPIVLASKFSSKIMVSFGMLAVAISTLATNIAANVVSPANDFSNLMPERIDFKRGGYLTGLFGTLIMPWKLIASPSGYIFTWLIGSSSLLGSIGGIMIADYFLIRKQTLVVDELYSRTGRYWFFRGFNPKALLAFTLGVLPNLPGFLETIGVLPTASVPAFFVSLYHHAWFVGFSISFALYYVLSYASGKIDAFDSSGERYEKAFKIFLDHTNQKAKAREKLNELVQGLRDTETFIDVGAGTGNVTSWFAPHFRRTVAIEPNLTLSEDFKRNCRGAELITDPIEEVRLNSQGDLVLCSHVLYYLDADQWVSTMERLAQWVSKDGMLVIILQNPTTDCMKMLRHFQGRGFDLASTVREFQGRVGHQFSVRVETVPSQIETNDLESATRISEFIVNLLPVTHPLREADLRAYVESNFKVDPERYRFSCDQDFVVITRAHA